MKYRTSAVRPIREYLADSLLGSDRVALFHRSGSQVAIYGNIGSMTDKDIKQPVQFEYGRHLAVEDGTRLCPRFSLAEQISLILLLRPAGPDKVQ